MIRFQIDFVSIHCELRMQNKNRETKNKPPQKGRRKASQDRGSLPYVAMWLGFRTIISPHAHTLKAQSI